MFCELQAGCFVQLPRFVLRTWVVVKLFTNARTRRLACKTDARSCTPSGVTRPKFYFGKCLALGEQKYFVRDAASQSTKWLDMLKIWGGGCMGPRLHPCTHPEQTRILNVLPLLFTLQIMTASAVLVINNPSPLWKACKCSVSSTVYGNFPTLFGLKLTEGV